MLHLKKLDVEEVGMEHETSEKPVVEAVVLEEEKPVDEAVVLGSCIVASGNKSEFDAVLLKSCTSDIVDSVKEPEGIVSA